MKRKYASAPIRLRPLTQHEFEVLVGVVLKESRKGTLGRRYKRARLILVMHSHPRMCAGKAGLLAGYTTRVPGAWWAKRFNAEGVEGLADRPRPGPSAKFREACRRRREKKAHK